MSQIKTEGTLKGLLRTRGSDKKEGKQSLLHPGTDYNQQVLVLSVFHIYDSSIVPLTYLSTLCSVVGFQNIIQNIF